MDPDRHGQPGVGADIGRPDDVEVETVFALGVADFIAAVADAFGRVGGCGTRRDEGFVEGLWRRETERGERWLRKGHAEEEVLVVLRGMDTAVGAVEGLGGGCGGCE